MRYGNYLLPDHRIDQIICGRSVQLLLYQMIMSKSVTTPIFLVSHKAPPPPLSPPQPLPEMNARDAGRQKSSSILPHQFMIAFQKSSGRIAKVKRASFKNREGEGIPCAHLHSASLERLPLLFLTPPPTAGDSRTGNRSQQGGEGGGMKGWWWWWW